MSFTVAYNIKAIDHFSKTANAVRQSIEKMERTAKSFNSTQIRASQIAKQNAVANNSNVVSLAAHSAASATSARKTREQSNEILRHKINMDRMRATIKQNNIAIKEAKRKEREYRQELKRREQQTRRTIATMRDMGNKATQVGNFMMTRMALPMIGLGALAYRESNRFNKSMATVGTLIPGQTEKLKQYKAEVQDMMVEFGRGGDVISAGLYQVISSVGDTTDTMKILEIANRAATAGNADTAASVNLLTGISSDYNDVSAAMMNRVSDLAFKTVELGVTTFPELAHEMGRTTTQAKTLGISVEELFGTYAGLTSGTVRTNMVSTRLAGVMNALTKDTPRLKKVYKELGVQSGKELVGMTGGLQRALFALRAELGNDELAFARLFEDQEARLGALALTGAKAQETAREIAAMSKSAGSTDRAFNEMTKGIGESAFKADQTRQKFARLSAEWGDKLIPLADRLMDRADELVTWLSSLDDETIESAVDLGIMAVKLGLVAKGIGAVLSFQGGMMQLASNIGGVGGQIDSVSGSASRLGTVMRGFTPVVASLVAGLKVGYEIWKWLEEQQAKEVEKENRAVKAFTGAKGMSLEEASTEQSRMISQWEEMDTRGRKYSEELAKQLLSSKHYAANDRKKRATLEAILRLESQITSKVKERADISAMRNRWMGGESAVDQTSAYFIGQGLEEIRNRQSRMDNMILEPRQDELLIKVQSEGGEVTEVTHEKQGAYSKLKIGSNT